MGVMKLIYTERKSHGSSLARFAPDERAAIRAIQRSSDLHLELLAEAKKPKPKAGGDKSVPVLFGTVYTGKLPSETGTYAVVDMVSNTRNIVEVRLLEGTWIVLAVGTSAVFELKNYNRTTFHWFRFLDLEADDMAVIGSDL